jgi:hypothetical protein
VLALAAAGVGVGDSETLLILRDAVAAAHDAARGSDRSGGVT